MPVDADIGAGEELKLPQFGKTFTCLTTYKVSPAVAATHSPLTTCSSRRPPPGCYARRWRGLAHTILHLAFSLTLHLRLILPPLCGQVLLFMGGSMTNMGRIEYSQGVRQAIQTIHRNQTDFVLGGKFSLDDLRASRYCLVGRQPARRTLPTRGAHIAAHSCESLHSPARLLTRLTVCVVDSAPRAGDGGGASPWRSSPSACQLSSSPT